MIASVRIWLPQLNRSVAQLVERFPYMEEDVGSSPIAPTKCPYDGTVDVAGLDPVAETCVRVRISLWVLKVECSKF